MAEITAAMVKELRERTQAGMSDCKKALVEASGDMAQAMEILQKKGKAAAGKRAGKIAAEGLVSAKLSADGRTGVLVELNCQTDFVARGDDFKALLADLAAAALSHETPSAEALLAVSTNGASFADRVENATARSGEKHDVRRVAYIKAGDRSGLSTYVHSNGQIAVVVEVQSSKLDDSRVVEFADDVCLQVASMSPLYLDKSEVPSEVTAKQREVFSALMDKEDAEALAAPDDFMKRVEAIVIERAQEEGRECSDPAAEARELVATDAKFKSSLDGYVKAAEKAKARPAAQREKILDGKVAKWLTEVVLLDQASVKESSKTIAKLQAELAGAVADTAIVRFVRYQVGEGVEKAVAKDFATEVAEMAAASQKN